MLRQTCYFSGRVQGVGFRYTVQNLALQYNVRVELVMEGPESEMKSLVDDVAQKMNGYIKRVDQSTAPATGEFKQFYVKH